MNNDGITFLFRVAVIFRVKVKLFVCSHSAIEFHKFIC